jgi:hypothetical protein
MTLGLRTVSRFSVRNQKGAIIMIFWSRAKRRTYRGKLGIWSDKIVIAKCARSAHIGKQSCVVEMNILTMCKFDKSEGLRQSQVGVMCSLSSSRSTFLNCADEEVPSTSHLEKGNSICGTIWTSYSANFLPSSVCFLGEPDECTSNYLYDDIRDTKTTCQPDHSHTRTIKPTPPK